MILCVENKWLTVFSWVNEESNINPLTPILIP